MSSESSLSILVATAPDDERRVAATPETVAALITRGFEISVEAGAGQKAFFDDGAYRDAGAAIVDDGSTWAGYEVILTVSPWRDDGIPEMSSGSLVVGFLDPFRRGRQLRDWAAGGASAAAMELVPRVTRAQSMDALSSQASIAGYKAVIVAANTLAQYFPLLMTAAGTVSPARVVVTGGGVAGLQALATAKRLGAVVEVSDVREAVREQVESLGGRFIDLPENDGEGEGSGGYAREMTPEFLDAQRQIVAERVARADVVICTAQVPGRKAPLLVTSEMVESMRPGSVIVDMAAAQGGNCQLTTAGQTVVHGGVTIHGPTNLASEVAYDASRLYARNLQELLVHLTGGNGEKPLELHLEDEITGQVIVVHDRKIARSDILGSEEGELWVR